MPPPQPEPVDCDDTHECPAGSTCCCLGDVAGFCLSWGCCPMPAATCCADKTHCCPSNLPVCDSESGRCLPPSASSSAPGSGLTAGAGAGAAGVPWATKTPARVKKGAAAAAPAAARFGDAKAAARGRKFIRDGGEMPAAS